MDQVSVVTRYADTNGVEYTSHYVPSGDVYSLDIKMCKVVRVIALCRGVAIIVSKNGTQWGHPGGKIERGESIDQAIIRELLEETNTRPIYITPLGYQYVTSEGKEPFYRLRFLCEVEKIGDFAVDPDGEIRFCKEVPLEELINYVHKDALDEYIILQARDISRERGIMSSRG